MRRNRTPSRFDLLGRLPRYQHGAHRINGHVTRFIDGPSFAAMAHAIFERQIYWFPAQRDDPRIIDGGANIGLATIYWKSVYPRAHVMAFEPDTDVFSVLTRNCATHGLAGVDLIRAALWSKTGMIGFTAEGADAGRINAASSEFHVPTYRLRNLLDDRVDFLKLDIEGAELEVLRDCASRLSVVERLFCEYHSFVDREQGLDEILAILRAAGFRYHLEPEMVSSRPFAYRPSHLRMDNQINIYAFRH